MKPIINYYFSNLTPQKNFLSFDYQDNEAFSLELISDVNKKFNASYQY